MWKMRAENKERLKTLVFKPKEEVVAIEDVVEQAVEVATEEVVVEKSTKSTKSKKKTEI